MDRQTRNIFMLGIIGVGVFLLARRTATKISIGSAGVRIHKINFDGVELRIELPVINESDFPAPVSAFLGQVYFGNTAIGLVQLQQPVQLPGFGQAIVPFRANLSLLSIGTTVWDIIQQSDGNAKNIDWSKFSIRGTLKVGPLPIDVNEKLLAA